MNRLRWMVPVFLAVLVLAPCVLALGWGTPAWAADEAEAADGHAVHGAEAEPGLLDIDVASAIVSIIIFLVLLVILTKLAWKPILNGLQAREATIRKAVEDAQKASDEARAMADEYKQKLDAATDEVRKIAEHAKKNAEAIAVRIEQDAKKTAENTVLRATRDIEQAKQTAIDEILGEVTSIATEAAGRIVKKNLSPEDNASLVDEIVREFSASEEGKAG